MTNFAATNAPATPPGKTRAETSIFAWTVVGSLLFWPRAAIIAFWIFSDLLGRAYDGWVIPVLGFLLLPYTTITYAVMWSVASNRVYGWEWIVVALALLMDLLVHAWTRALAS